jgi:hypothetical protein
VEIFIKVNIIKAYFKENVFINTMMAEFIQEFLKMVKEMDLVL